MLFTDIAVDRIDEQNRERERKKKRKFCRNETGSICLSIQGLNYVSNGSSLSLSRPWNWEKAGESNGKENAWRTFRPIRLQGKVKKQAKEGKKESKRGNQGPT